MPTENVVSFNSPKLAGLFRLACIESEKTLTPPIILFIALQKKMVLGLNYLWPGQIVFMKPPYVLLITSLNVTAVHIWLVSEVH